MQQPQALCTHGLFFGAMFVSSLYLRSTVNHHKLEERKRPITIITTTTTTTTKDNNNLQQQQYEEVTILTLSVTFTLCHITLLEQPVRQIKERQIISK
jgi:hypothetical protein